MLIRKRIESNKEIKRNERKQNRVNIIDEGIDLGRFFELPASDKIYVNSLTYKKLKMTFTRLKR